MKILYVGGFQLPDKNAAAQRVVNIAKALRDLGHEVIFLHNVKGVKKVVLKNYFGFRCYECGKNPLKYNLGISTIRQVVKDEKIEAIIAYNYPSIALNELVVFCEKNKIKSTGISGNMSFRKSLSAPPLSFFNTSLVIIPDKPMKTNK